MRESTLNLIITVVSGVLVYVFSQLFTEFVLRPIQDYKRLKAKVATLNLPGAFYIGVNAQYQFLPEQIEDKGIAILGDIGKVLKDVRAEKERMERP